MTVSGFPLWIVLLLKNTGDALLMKGFWYMLRFMYFEVDYLILSLFQGKISEANKDIYIIFHLLKGM